MNYLRVPFSYHWILRRLIGEDIDTVLDLGCSDGDLMNDIARKQGWVITGVDIHGDSLKKATKKNIYSELIESDITRISEKLNKKYDLVFLSQVVEHLEKKVVSNTLAKWESLAKKRIVLSTTIGHIDYTPIESKKEDDNPYQEHKSGWSIEYFTKRGYKVRGQGLRLIYGKNGLARKFPFVFFPIFSFIGLIFSPVVYFVPRLGLIMICVKEFGR